MIAPTIFNSAVPKELSRNSETLSHSTEASTVHMVVSIAAVFSKRTCPSESTVYQGSWRTSVHESLSEGGAYAREGYESVLGRFWDSLLGPAATVCCYVRRFFSNTAIIAIIQIQFQSINSPAGNSVKNVFQKWDAGFGLTARPTRGRARSRC